MVYIYIYQGICYEGLTLCNTASCIKLVQHLFGPFCLSRRSRVSACWSSSALHFGLRVTPTIVSSPNHAVTFSVTATFGRQDIPLRSQEGQWVAVRAPSKKSSACLHETFMYVRELVIPAGLIYSSYSSPRLNFTVYSSSSSSSTYARTCACCHSCQDTAAVRGDGMRANREIGDEVCEYTYLITCLIPAGRAVRTSPRVLTLRARLLQASRAVHRRLRSAANSTKPACLGLSYRPPGTNRRAIIPGNTDPGS